MDLNTTQASLRRSSRKRRRDTSGLILNEAEHETHNELYTLTALTRRAVEKSNADTPSRAKRARRAGHDIASSTSAQERSRSTVALSRPIATLTLSHDDPVPANSCSKCRVRGGNYAYTCVYENGSDTCKRCMLEKNKCRPATPEEIARFNARCPQCKSRGLTKCWYENGNTSCAPCIKWKKKCGAPMKRMLNATTRSFLSVPTPEPEQNSADNEQIQSASQAPASTKSPSRARRTTRQGTITPSSQIDQVSMVTEWQPLNDGQSSRPAHAEHEQSKADARHAFAVVIKAESARNDKVAGHDAAPLDRTPMRGSRRTSRQSRTIVSPSVIQEPTPDDSAVEEIDLLSVHDDMSGDESTDARLIVESDITAPRSSSPVIATKSHYIDAMHEIGLDEEGSDNEVSMLYQRRVSVADRQASRPQRTRSRPSYVECTFKDSSDEDVEHGENDDDDDDLWDPPAVEDESEIDEDPELSAALESSSDEAEDYEDCESVDIEPDVLTASRRKSQQHVPKQGKGIDLSLPPLHDISDIIADMASKALPLGLRDALQALEGQSINVATMCSGTESPLLFLQMMAEALDSMGEKTLHVKHHFSAEIDATKQAYIERNFHPPILFRDVRQLGDDTTTKATTAYGAEEPIPAGIDILIAGFVCKDLSSLNSKKKTVDDQGETGDTWRAIYYYAKRFHPSIVLLENVKSDRKVWDDVVSRWSRIGYEAAWVYCDTKNYYLPQTRERMYMIAINRNLHGKDVSEAVAGWRDTMEKLQRQCSSPYEAFLVDLPVEVIDHSSLSTEPDWNLCKLRYDQIRSEQRLGIRRPITQWNENGTLHPPDFANRSWYDSQSSRVYDAIDVAHLQAAQEGHDSMYKMKIWDVSQNVDRFKTGLGLVPCITPGGSDFASNRQTALSGRQTLLLQGMPLHKLHFAGETQKECQDLAGNAMSTTVIGAALISAIIHGYTAFGTESSTNILASNLQKPLQSQSHLVRANAMMEHDCSLTDPAEISVAQLLNEAKLSSRLCTCEGDQGLTDKPIKSCSACGHTACVLCASNPRHQYVSDIPQHLRKQVPAEFARLWKPRLPPRLELHGFPSVTDYLHQLRKDHSVEDVQRIAEIDIGSQQFCLSDFARCDNAWKVLYAGSEMRLVLSIGEELQWLLYVDCPSGFPGNSALRKILENPIARAIVDNSMLEAQWELFTPGNQEHNLRMHASVERSRSWRNVLGLPDFERQTVPTNIRIESNNDETDVLEGDYTHLPHCGTAEASLYKRSSEPVLYMFLDPDPIGSARDDCFVFSPDCSRKRWLEPRMVTARLDSAWRPSDMCDTGAQHNVTVVRTGFWRPIPTRMVPSLLAPTASVLMPNTPLTDLEGKCTTAVSVLDVHLSETLRIGKFSDYAWVLEQLKAAPSLEHWQSICGNIQDDCTCAPAYPSLQWSVDAAGKATPHEDRKAAATFEKGIKTRTSAFYIETAVARNQAHIEVGISLFSLAHRARGRLVRFTNNAEQISTSWRLLVNHANAGPVRFEKFRLRSNATDVPFSGPLSLAKELRGAQPRALAWMRAQETGRPLDITEVEEAVHAGLGWRAEARAQTTVSIRGGVLADLPSFGKTVTTIALLQSEFENLSPEAIVAQNRAAAELGSTLIDTAATLIVCPPHIAMQWQTELNLFLGDEQYERFHVCVIREMAELKRLSIDDIQQSRVVVVSWSVLSDDDYISELARITAMPEPASSSCRAFDAWMDGVSKDLPAQTVKLQTMSLADFEEATQKLLEKRSQRTDFQATLPLRLQHGSKYQSYETTRATGGQDKRAKAKLLLKRKSTSSNSRAVPLLHLFRFNRLVVDEYHYLNDYKKIRNMFTAVSVKKISAHKRWILSGTPALENFTDIDNIASFLGVRLGRFARGVGKRTALETFLVDDQTAVERFLSKTEVMSDQWHYARHERAQQFLDLFVRQNEASLEHIPCHEELRAIELSLAHKAVYLELLKHLIAQRMQLKKLRNKAESDRTSRLNASLNHSKTPEDALLKAALINKTSERDDGLCSLIEKRSSQRRDIEEQISTSIRCFEWHKSKGFKGLKPADPKKIDKEENTVPKLYASFKQDTKANTWLGDNDVTMIIQRLLRASEAKPRVGGFEELREFTGDKKIRAAKTIMSRLRESCTDLVLQRRSERFIESIQQLVQVINGDTKELISCDAQDCQKTVTVSGIYLASHCGHLTCKPCLMARGDDENCVVPGCNCTVQDVNLIKATDLGSSTNVVEHGLGRKMHSIASLLQRISDDDQCLVFAPNDETVAMLADGLDRYNISHRTPSGYNSRQAAKIIEEFKSSANEDVKSRPKALLLNLASETAAGVNLTNTNHIIFVAPLLVESQYKYDSAMTQAIARSRRYGQEKTVHIYHFAALRTIDVDILEHRHKHTYGITSAKSTVRMPSSALAVREKTRLVKNKHGSMALVPISWLADDKIRERMGVEKEPEKFTSLINFSDTFEDGEE